MRDLSYLEEQPHHPFPQPEDDCWGSSFWSKGGESTVGQNPSQVGK